MPESHTYKTTITWTGNAGRGTADYKSYERAHEVTGDGKHAIAGSSDPAFRGDNLRYNTEELLIGSRNFNPASRALPSSPVIRATDGHLSKDRFARNGAPQFLYARRLAFAAKTT